MYVEDMKHMWWFRNRPRRQLVSLPWTYFEVKDVRPDDLGDLCIEGNINSRGNKPKYILKF